MSDLYLRHADICKTFSNPKRLEVINALRDNVELTASQLLAKIDISKANLSQHMSLLVQKGVVKSRREGVSISYRLADERITQACDIMRDILLSKISGDSELLKRKKTL